MYIRADPGHLEQANSENCGPLHGNKFDLEKGQGQVQGHGMVSVEGLVTRIIHAKYRSFCDKQTDGQMSLIHL